MAARLLVACLFLIALLGGCTDPEAAGTQSGSASDDARSRSPLDSSDTAYSVDAISFTGDGTLALGNCWDSPAGAACIFNVGDPTSTTQAGNIVHFPIEDARGSVSAATVTLTWTASSPLTDQLELRFTALECGRSCSTHHTEAVTVGSSPLTLELPATTLEDGLTLGVTVARAEAGMGMRASLLQDFTVEGRAEPA